MTLNPRILFLIDGFGALLSAFLLGIVLTRFESIFGMPKNELYFLSFLPCIFAIYDFSCYLLISENWKPFLKTIAIANLMYCLISIGLVVYNYQKLTDIGMLYFLLELTIVLILASIELKKVTKLAVIK